MNITLIYCLLHQLYRPLRDDGIIKMMKGVEYKELDEVLELELNEILKNIKFKEADNLLITNKGLLMIFPLMLEGQVFGNNTGSKWIQRHNHKQIYIPNPITFNEERINYLKVKDSISLPINNLVVFVNNNNQNVRSKMAVNLRDLENTLINFETDINLTDEDINDLVKELSKK